MEWSSRTAAARTPLRPIPIADWTTPARCGSRLQLTPSYMRSMVKPERNCIRAAIRSPLSPTSPDCPSQMDACTSEPTTAFSIVSACDEKTDWSPRHLHGLRHRDPCAEPRRELADLR